MTDLAGDSDRGRQRWMTPRLIEFAKSASASNTASGGTVDNFGDYDVLTAYASG